MTEPAKYGRTIAEQWNEYRRRVMPATVDDDERLMRRIDAEFVQFAADVKAGRA